MISVIISIRRVACETAREGLASDRRSGKPVGAGSTSAGWSGGRVGANGRTQRCQHSISSITGHFDILRHMVPGEKNANIV